MVTVDETLAAMETQRAEAEARRARGPAARRKFRSSLPWRRVRYAVLRENALRQPDGKPRCELCGAGAEPGRPLHVDHREPVSKRWDLRFARSNLVVLCPDCNVGKLAGPDWRQAKTAGT